VALAVATDVLPPDDPDAAKNLGLYNIATALPQSAAPVLGSLVLAAGGGYAALFVLAGVAAVAAAPMVGRLRDPGRAARSARGLANTRDTTGSTPRAAHLLRRVDGRIPGCSPPSTGGWTG
jgi:MFS family permease